MTTFAEAKTAVARDLRDPGNSTFVDAEIGDMVQSAIAELGRIAPRRFQEDLDVTDDTLDYALQADYFAALVPEIELLAVEVWDVSVTPMRFVRTLLPSAMEADRSSASGYRIWNGTLYLPNGIQRSLVTNQHALRVWGYSPYVQPANDDTELDLSSELYFALRDYCRVEGLAKLLNSRDLYTQWQTRTGNTDVSPASLMGQLSVARDDWRRRKRELMILRER